MLDLARPLGPQWFRIFREKLAADWEEDWGSNDTQWTKSMLDFLAKTGKSLGYETQREVGKKDMVWLRERSIEVHIEHENDGDDWDYLKTHEIRDLMDTNSKLKVLITYVRRNTYPAKAYATKLRELLRQQGNWDAEFLLVVSPWYPTESADYVAHHFQPSVAHELLVIPTGGNS